MRIKYNYHMVDISPYPLYTSISLLILLLNIIIYLNKFDNIFYYGWIYGLFGLLLNLYLWWKDIIKESFLKGEHNNKIESSLNIGFILFVISEFLIFGSFFFSFFYSSFIPDILLSSFWPPKGILTLSSFSIPLLNTSLLFFSGFSITAAQYILSNSSSFNLKDSIFYIILTLFLAFLFLLFQIFEYFSSPFTINDSVFGSLFFLLTGFHGLHVIVGFLFIFFALFRLYFLQFSENHYLHFSFAALYYHFVRHYLDFFIPYSLFMG